MRSAIKEREGAGVGVFREVERNKHTLYKSRSTAKPWGMAVTCFWIPPALSEAIPSLRLGKYFTDRFS